MQIQDLDKIIYQLTIEDLQNVANDGYFSKFKN